MPTWQDDDFISLCNTNLESHITITLFFDLLHILDVSGQAIFFYGTGTFCISCWLFPRELTNRNVALLCLEFYIAQRETKVKIPPTCKSTIDVVSTPDCMLHVKVNQCRRWSAGSIERIS
jgi:hypothetical protein